MPPPLEQQDRTLPRVLPTLTGLRAVAAGVVFFRHAEYLYDNTGVSYWTWRLFVQGGVGVSFFFVLSGFVLTWSWRGGRGDFYRRRFARIYPAYFVTWAIGGLVILYVGAQIKPSIALTCLGLVQAWSSDQAYILGMNGVSWSLSCEAFFYAMFPFMIVLLVRAPSWAIRVTLAAAVTGVLLYPSVATAHLVIGTLHITYMSPLIRALEFICGIALALEVRRGRWPRVPLWLAWPLAAVGYLLAGQAGLWYGSGAWFTIYYSFVAATIVPFVILIGAYATRDVAGGRSLFRSRTAIRLGEWSYSFYLVHFLVITVFLHATDNWRPGGVPAAALATAFLLVVALACAAALYHFVERPCEKRIRGSLRTPTAELVARDALAHSPS